MWRRFTERARRVVFFAQEEARKSGSSRVDTEHLLGGLLRQGDSLAGRVMQAIGVDLLKLQEEAGRCMPKGDASPGQDLKLTTRAKRVIDIACDEARQARDGQVGTEHLLLGLVCAGGRTTDLLEEFGAEPSRIRRALQQVETCGEEGMGKLGVIDDTLRGRDLVSIRDLSGEQVWKIFTAACSLKSCTRQEQIEQPLLAGKTLAMIFEKPSLRTRVTFEVGMTQLGGHAIYLQPSDIQLGARESVSDAARNLERWVDGIMARTFSHKTVTELAKHGRIPVINGLSDREHPCQALADFFTIHEKKGDLSGVKLAYIGDGCNTCHSLMLLAAKVGAHMAVACPEGYEPDTAILTSAQRDAKETGSLISVTNDPFEAVKEADVIYTDVWASMGQEDEREKRVPVFQPFQVNQKLVDAAADDVMVMHCMPAHRGEEITDEVLDGPKSVAFDQAENRLHVQKAILALLL